LEEEIRLRDVRTEEEGEKLFVARRNVKESVR